MSGGASGDLYSLPEVPVKHTYVIPSDPNELPKIDPVVLNEVPEER